MGISWFQRTIRSLVVRAQLDWTEDFRRQDSERLATLFRAARTYPPVLLTAIFANCVCL